MPTEFIAPDPGPTPIIVSASKQPEPLQETTRDAIDTTHRRNDATGKKLVVTSKDVKIAPPQDAVPDVKPIKKSSLATDNVKRTVEPLAKSRTPLAPLSAQSRLQGATMVSSKSPDAKAKTVSVSLSAKTAFKPTPAPRSLPKNGVSSDTRNLLAALHALKQPPQ